MPKISVGGGPSHAQALPGEPGYIAPPEPEPEPEPEAAAPRPRGRPRKTPAAGEG
jgi:hypothetical protein